MKGVLNDDGAKALIIKTYAEMTGLPDNEVKRILENANYDPKKFMSADGYEEYRQFVNSRDAAKYRKAHGARRLN